MHETALTNQAHARLAPGPQWNGQNAEAEGRSEHPAIGSNCRAVLASLPPDARFRRRLAQRLTLAAERQRPLAVLALAIEPGAASDPALGVDALEALREAFASRLVHALRPGALLTLSSAARALPASASASAAHGTFSCVLEDVPLAAEFNARLVALQRALAQPLMVAGREQPVRVHIGIALCPSDGRTGDELCRRARAAATRATAQDLDISYFGASEE